MLNQLKADYYKLRHSSVFWIVNGLIIILFCALLGMSRSNEGYYMGFAREMIGVEPVLDGFVAFAFEDRANPSFWEIIYSATALTFILWIILMVLTVQVYSQELQNGTIKLSVAYGKNRLVLFYSKLIVVLSYFGSLYYTFNIIGYLFCVKATGVALTRKGILELIKLTTLFFMIFVIFTMICMILCSLYRNAVFVSTCMLAYMYSVVFLILGVMDRKIPFLLNVYFHINPMYYLWKASGYWAQPDITKEIIIFFITGFIFLSICINFIENKHEIK